MNPRHKILSLVPAVVFSAFALSAAAPRITVSADRADALYKQGDSIIFTAALNDNALEGAELEYTLKADGGILRKGKWKAEAKNPLKVSVSMDRPGFALFKIALPDVPGKKRTVFKAGAGVSPGKIRAGTEKPADFDDYWAEELRKLREVPVKAEIREAPEFLEKNPKLKQYAGKMRTYDVRLSDGVVNAAGVLTVPLKTTPLGHSAVVLFGGAGWLGALAAPAPVRDYNAIAFHMNIHDSPNFLPASEAKKVRRAVAGYQYKNLDKRDEYYMRKVFLRIVRVLDYVKSRPEWNRKVLAVRGPSMGGCQAIVAAALDRDVTICVPGAPAMCDHLGFRGNQANGYPDLVNSGYYGDKAKRGAAERNSAYFDAANFARSIRCEAVFGVGFIDETCPPTSVYAAYNNVPSKKKTILNAVLSGHNGKAFSCDAGGRVRALCGEAAKKRKTSIPEP